MPTRVLHLSDLHFGRNDRPESIEALGRLIEEARPDLVIASGDLTHRGLRSQHERASSFLRSLELPLLAIPLAAVAATLIDVIVRDKNPADEETPAVIFSAKDAEAS